jgi:acyl-CoA reductase-like NAD-dependent aldehyde dehydrogenase
MHGDAVPLDQKDTLDFAIRVPFGVVACVTAWNSPVAILTNTYRVAAPQAPFGGCKDSGFGRVRGEAGILEFTQTKNVFIDFSGDRRDPLFDEVLTCASRAWTLLNCTQP